MLLCSWRFSSEVSFSSNQIYVFWLWVAFSAKTSDIVLTNPAEVVFSFSYNVKFQIFKASILPSRSPPSFSCLEKFGKTSLRCSSHSYVEIYFFAVLSIQRWSHQVASHMNFSFSLLCNNIKSLMSTFYSRARFSSEPDLATFSLASLPFSTLFFRADFRDALNIAYFIFQQYIFSCSICKFKQNKFQILYVSF